MQPFGKLAVTELQKEKNYLGTDERGERVSSGVYLYQLGVANLRLNKKVTLIK